jgi:hypothetical protein
MKVTSRKGTKACDSHVPALLSCSLLFDYFDHVRDAEEARPKADNKDGDSRLLTHNSPLIKPVPCVSPLYMTFFFLFLFLTQCKDYASKIKCLEYDRPYTPLSNEDLFHCMHAMFPMAIRFFTPHIDLLFSQQLNKPCLFSFLLLRCLCWL